MTHADIDRTSRIRNLEVPRGAFEMDLGSIDHLDECRLSLTEFRR
jgi:hypothetical protein